LDQGSGFFRSRAFARQRRMRSALAIRAVSFP
jgi:hypothetical protein